MHMHRLLAAVCTRGVASPPSACVAQTYKARRIRDGVVFAAKTCNYSSQDEDLAEQIANEIAVYRHFSGHRHMVRLEGAYRSTRKGTSLIYGQ